MPLFLFLWLLLLSFCLPTINGEDDASYEPLVEWIRSNGGRVEETISTRVFDDGVRGMVALADMDEGVELLQCPWKLVIGATSSNTQTDADMCRTVRLLERELALGKEI